MELWRGCGMGCSWCISFNLPSTPSIRSLRMKERNILKRRLDKLGRPPALWSCGRRKYQEGPREKFAFNPPILGASFVGE